MKTKVVEHIANDIWGYLQEIHGELLNLRNELDYNVSGAQGMKLNLSVALEKVSKAKTLTSLLTKEDYAK